MDQKDIVAHNIRFTRKWRDMTQNAFAKALKITVPMLYTYESGRTPPDDLVLEKLASLAEVPVIAIKKIKLSIKILEDWPHDEKKITGYIKKIEEAQKEESEVESLTLHDDGADGFNKKSQPLSMQALADLAASNREMAEAHKILASSQADLVTMLKQATGGDAAGMNASLEKRLSDILMKLAEVGTGKRWGSLKEATEELNKLLIAP